MNTAQKQSVYRKILGNFLVIAGFTFVILGFGPVVYDEFSYYLRKTTGTKYVINESRITGSVDTIVPSSLFSSLLASNSIDLVPVNTKFSLVIEKIGLNVPIVENVSVLNEQEYLKALKDGIAHASVSNYPSQLPGNTYLFAHSSLDFWRLGKYAKAFNLLNKLEIGDKIHVFYDNRDYVYEVVNSEILAGWNIHPLDRKVLSPVLTLQTCDPPGTTLNRLVVTAKLVNVK